MKTSEVTESERMIMEGTKDRMGFLLRGLRVENTEDLESLLKYTEDALSHRENLYGFITIDPRYGEEPVELRFNKYVLQRLLEIRKAQDKLERGEKRFER